MKKLLIAVLACLALVLAACGGDDDEDGTTTSSAPVDTIQVKLTEYALTLEPSSFDSENPSIDTSGVVEFEATNDGQIEHSLEVEGPEGDAELEQPLQPGDSGTLRVNLSKAGRYEWYCPIGNHADRGMRGEITVGGGGATDTDDTGTTETSTTGTTETGTTETGTTETETGTGTTETESGEDSGGSGSNSGKDGGGETGGSGGY